MGGRYYWLQLKKDFFYEKEMKKLGLIAGGDTYIKIYLKMLLASLTDEGYLFYEGIEDDFASELALQLDENVENVRVVINFLQRTGLLTANEDTFFLTKIPEMIGSECASAARVRKHRNKKKQEELALQSNITALPCNDSVTKCNDRREDLNLDIDLKTDIDLEREKESLSSSLAASYRQVLELYSSICVSYPKLRSLSELRKKAIRARLNTYSMADFETVFRKAEASSFLKGANDRNWSATFDWMLKDANFAKILEGNYDSRENKKNNVTSTKEDIYARFLAKED